MATAPAAKANVGTKAISAKPCARTPPTLLDPATHPVARPRQRTGKLSEVYGKRMEITALVPTTSRDTDMSGSEITENGRIFPYGPKRIAGPANLLGIVKDLTDEAIVEPC